MKSPNSLALKMVVLFVVLTFSACNKEINTLYDYPLNEIESIKNTDYLGKEYYGAIEFTPETFLSKKSNHLQEIKAGFLFQEQKASVTFSIDFKENKVSIISLGEESNYFLTALSSLYEEHIQSSEMKYQVDFYFDKESIADKSLPEDQLHFDIKNSHAEAILVIDLQKGSIKMMEKNAGLEKQNFVKVFEKE